MLPTIDRDEARFAQASRQMLESVVLPEADLDPVLHRGGAILPLVGGRERINKPPMIYWLQASAAGILTLGQPQHDAIWMYRVPSLIAGIITLLVLWRAASLRFGPRIGLLACLMLAASPLFAWEVRQARSDMVLVAATTLAMAALWSLWDGRGRTRYTPLVLWLAVTVGVLTKGPVVLIVVLLAALTLSITTRRWRWLARTQPWIGALLIAGTIGPWLYAVGERVGHADLWQRLLDETLGRSLEPAEGHSGPPGYHLLLSAALFWPGVVLAGREFVGAIARLVRTTRRRVAPRPSLLFLAAWLIPTWLVMELISTKLPHYVLPLYPALAVLCARAVITADRSSRACSPLASSLDSDRGVAIGTWLWRWGGVLLLVGVPLVFALIVGPIWWPIFVVMLAVGWFPPPNPLAQAKTERSRLGWAGAESRALLAAAAFALLIPVGIALSPSLHITQQIVRELDAPSLERVGAVGYHEDSLVFATRGKLTRLNADALPQFIAEHPDATLILPDELVTPDHRVRTIVAGFNYSKGKRQTYSIIVPTAQRDLP